MAQPGSEFTAIVRVAGPGRLDEFREQLRWLMVRDVDAENYTEHHAGDALEYRFELKKGVPFAAFANASEEFPELRVEADWRNTAQGVRGRAVIQGGRLLDQETAPIDRGLLALEIECGAHGELVFGLACVRDGAAWLGYCASAERHAYFRLDQAGELRLDENASGRWSGPGGGEIEPALLERLEEIAFRFAGDWLWYDEDATPASALERKHYADHGWTVAGANLRSEQLLRIGLGQLFSTLPPEARPLAQRLRGAWARKA
ncbi:MAG TPA: hypothetical protein VLX30_16860 [Burkholderiales bacterium]|nr:hypothetical protein [Burkholderiales bacterium]